MLDGVRLAVGTLTILPTGRVEVTCRAAAVAMAVAPLAVLPLAVIVAAAGWLGLRLSAPDLVTAIVVLGLIALGTRALHLDGLADTVDGLGAGWDRTRALEVMRRGDVGPMGVVALVLVLGLQAAAAAEILSRPSGWLTVAALLCVSRGALALTCARPLQPARATGLGAAVIGSVPVWIAVAIWAVLLYGCGLLAYAGGLPRWHGLAAAAAAATVVLIMAGWCTRRLGGLTGDVLGATIELAFTALLITFSL